MPEWATIHPEIVAKGRDHGSALQEYTQSSIPTSINTADYGDGGHGSRYRR